MSQVFCKDKISRISFYILLYYKNNLSYFHLLTGTPVEKVKGVIISETDSPASPTGPDSGNPNAPEIDSNAPILPPKPGMTNGQYYSFTY